MGETISSLVAVAMVEISRRMEESEDQEAAVSLAALLEDSDKQVGLAVKAVVEQRLESSFEKALGLHARRKQLEVRRICAAHYEDFAASVDSLLAVKEDLAMLRERAVAVNKGVQESGEVVLAKARQLMEFRRLRQNLAEALALVSSCQYIMQLAAKAMEQIAVGKYFSALRTLEQLQRNQLAEFREFEFVEFLEQQIPIMLFAIRQSVKAQFDEWLQR